MFFYLSFGILLSRISGKIGNTLKRVAGESRRLLSYFRRVSQRGRYNRAFHPFREKHSNYREVVLFNLPSEWNWIVANGGGKRRIKKRASPLMRTASSGIQWRADFNLHTDVFQPYTRRVKSGETLLRGRGPSRAPGRFVLPYK